MRSQWIAAVVSLAAVGMLGLGLSRASLVSATPTPVALDGDGPLHKVMEGVNKQNNTLRKGVRTAVAYKKSYEEVLASSEEMVKLAKEAKEIKDLAKKLDKVKEWDELSDKFTESAEQLLSTVKDKEKTQKDANDQWKAMGKTCTECHNVFRIDEDDPFGR